MVGTPRRRGPIFAAEPPPYGIRPLLADGAARLRFGPAAASRSYASASGFGTKGAPTAQAARHLQDLGAVVEQVDPCTEDPLDITTGLWFAGAYQVWRTLTTAQQALTDPDFKAQAELGAKLDASALHALNQRRGVLGSQLRQFMQGFDLILTPSTAVPAFKALPAGHSPMTSEAMLGWTPFSYPFNLSQQPAISLPCGLTSEGLPMGVQLVGPMFGDALVLQAAQALQACYPVLRPTLGR